MSPKNSRYFLILLAFLFMAGCRGGSKVVTKAEHYDFGKMKESSWAIGGVYLNSDYVPDGVARKEIDPYLAPWSALSEMLSPKLYGGFMRIEPGMEVWTFSTVASLVPEPDLMAVSELIAKSRVPSLETMMGLAENLPDVRYLVFARLDDSKIVTNQGFVSQALDQRNRDGREPHANTLARTATISRGVYMSMEVYDLEDGTMVWSGAADTWNEILLTGDSNIQSKDVLVLKEGESSEVTDIQLDGIMRKGPSLFEGTAETSVKLVSALKFEIVESDDGP